jgi:protein-disulfide isomerase
VAALLSIPACVDTSSAAQQVQGISTSPDDVVAKVAGRKITMKDVDAKWEEFDAAERNRVAQELYQNRRNMLDQIVGEVLVERAAKAANMNVDDYLKAESEKLLLPVTDADVRAFFEQNKDRANGRSVDELRKPIQEFLEGQRRQQAKAQLVDNLRSKESAIRVMLEPPRYKVEVLTHDPIRGDQAAPITIVEFSDYQCPFCQRVNPTLDKVRETYGNKVRIVFKDFPLPNHPLAPKAAEAAHCAGEQGKYWELHDVMFGDQRKLDVPSIKASAAGLGLTAAQFDQCLDSGKYAAAVAEDMALGEKLGVNSTPTLYVNGRAVIGAQPFEQFKRAIDDELARQK